MYNTVYCSIFGSSFRRLRGLFADAFRRVYSSKLYTEKCKEMESTQLASGVVTRAKESCVEGRLCSGGGAWLLFVWGGSVVVVG